MTTADSLPALTGSDKQIAWATQIRARLAPQIEAHLASLDRLWSPDRAAKARTNAALLEQLEEAQEETVYLRAFLACADSGLWIDHQRHAVREIWRGRGKGTARKYGLPVSLIDGF